jgi:hypothetical protein
MKKHHVVALIGTLALLANLIIPGLAFGQVPQAQTGTADIGCSATAPAYTAIVPAAAFNFTRDGEALNPGVNSLVASNVEQYAFNNPTGANLDFNTGNDYVQIIDIRDPSLHNCNNGLTLTLSLTPPFETADHAHNIPTDDLHIVTNPAACSNIPPNSEFNGICYDSAALCGAGDGNAAAACSGNDGDSVGNYADPGHEYRFGEIATYNASGVDLGSDQNIMDFPDGGELFGKASIGVSYGLVIPAAQPAGTYTAELVYTLTGA